jgi:hypothetical protein
MIELRKSDRLHLAFALCKFSQLMPALQATTKSVKIAESQANVLKLLFVRRALAAVLGRYFDPYC